ncbi:MAG: T9SS type A sorting domain-containing protein, partial [Bacteroidetes bacterium]|nr:T9SS type A sorting domain-containing protein [Bacteroidota bacterium]
LRIQIRFATASGNNLYLDNFSLGTWHTSVEEPLADISAFKIYPNPAKNLLNINLSSAQISNFTVTINNLTGQTMLTMPITTHIGINNYQVNTAHLPKGIYFIHLQNDKERLKQKLVID